MFRIPIPVDKLIVFFILILTVPLIYKYFAHLPVDQPLIFLFCTCVFVFLVVYYKNLMPPYFPRILFGCMIIVILDIGIVWQNGGFDFYYKGKIRGVNDPWAELQFYAKDHSQKDDLFIVPPYLNDFCNYSQRAILGDWAEGANILYLDNQFAAEWFERMRDLGWTERSNAREGFSRLTTDDIKKAAQKYSARFVVAEKPKIFNLGKAYENSKYCLYEIK